MIFKVYTNIQPYKSRNLADLTFSTYGPSKNTRGEQSTGNLLYNKYCLMCHQVNGSGVPGMFPPLAHNSKVTGPSTDLIRIVLFGLEGPIVVNGKDFNQSMPPQDYLNDKQISDILSFIRNSWGNKAPNITPAEVVKARKSGNMKK